MEPLPADHPLARLQAQAALATGWPTLHLTRPTEAALEEARAALEAHLGPLPQADVIEPWDPEEPWELRIDLPGWPPEAWVEVVARWPEAVLAPGVREGARSARDLGLLQDEIIEAGGVRATMACPLREGGAVALDLRPGRADAEIERLERDLVLALQAEGVAAAFASERGPDTVLPVVHRPTGRFGAALFFGPDAFAGLDGDAVLRLRERIVGVLGGVVAARAAEPTVRLAPDLSWSLSWGLEIVLWFVAPAVPGLPGDQEVQPGVQPFPAGLSDRVAGLDGLVEHLEVQVVPASPADHDRVVAAVLAGAEGRGLVGAAPRWVRAAGSWAFTPVWGVPLVDLDPAALGETVGWLGGIPGVWGVRVVPGAPEGVEAWSTLDPSWHVGSERWWLRLRDGVEDRDALARVTDREQDARDAGLERTLRSLLAPGVPRAHGVRLEAVRFVADTAGRPGVELEPSAAAAREEPLRALLDTLGGLPMRELCTLGFWGHRDGIPVVRLWWRHGTA